MFVSQEWGFRLLFSLSLDGPGQLERERRPVFQKHGLGEPFPHRGCPSGFQGEAVSHSEDSRASSRGLGAGLAAWDCLSLIPLRMRE